MGNILTTYLATLTQCIRIRRQNIKRKTSQQLIDTNHINDGFLYDDDDDDDNSQDEKLIFYKPKTNTLLNNH